MRKDYEAAFSHSSHGNLRNVSRCIILQKQKASSQLFSVDSGVKTWQFKFSNLYFPMTKMVCFLIQN